MFNSIQLNALTIVQYNVKLNTWIVSLFYFLWLVNNGRTLSSSIQIINFLRLHSASSQSSSVESKRYTFVFRFKLHWIQRLRPCFEMVKIFSRTLKAATPQKFFSPFTTQRVTVAGRAELLFKQTESIQASLQDGSGMKKWQHL